MKVRTGFFSFMHTLFNPTEAARDAVKAATERQEIPFSRQGSGSSAIRLFQSEAEWDQYSDRLGRFRNTKIDFQSEVGELSDSSLVMAAVRWLGKNLPEAPLRVMKTEGDKSTAVIDHPLVMLLKKPTEYFSGQTLWKSFAADWIISGNVYLQKIRNAFKDVIGLRFWPYYQIRPHWAGLDASAGDPTKFVDFYQVKVDNRVYEIPLEDVVHFRDGLDTRTRCGVSPLNSVLREIYTDNEIATYSAVTLKNLGVAPFAVVPDGDVEIDGKSVKEAIERAITGDNRARIPVIDAPVKFPTLGMKAKDMSLATMGGRPETRIPAVIGINAVVLYLEAGLAHSIYHNVSEAREEAIEQYLIPLQRYISEELELQLLPDLEKNTKGFSISYDYSEVRALQPDQDKLFERWGKLFIQGGCTRARLLSETGQTFSDIDNVYYMSRGAGLVLPNEKLVPAGSVTGVESTGAPAPTATKAIGSGMQPTDAEITKTEGWLDSAVPAAKGILSSEAVQ